MIAAANILTGLYLSGAALMGLATLHFVLMGRDGWDPLNRRFLFGIRATMLLFAGRFLIVVTGVAAFRVLVLLGAALIPLAVLLLTEGLLRRHAPGWAKTLIASGTVVFGVTAFWFGTDIDPYRLYGLLLFQIAGFGLAGWLIAARDPATLSPDENMMVTRLGLSLFVLIPAAVGDFLLQALGLPIQMSALAVLILCWLAIGLGRAHMGHRATLLSLAIMIAAGLIVGLMIGILGQLGRDGTILTVAALLATLFVVAIFNDARALQAEEQSHSLMRHLAGAATDDPLQFLRELQAHPRVEGAAIISHASLSGLQDKILATIFAAAPVLRRADPPSLGPAADDHIAYLFERYSATHIMQAADDPRVLIALSMPSLRASPSAELELLVVQRMAMLMAARKDQKDG